MVHGDVIKPAGSKLIDGIAFLQTIDLIKVILHYGKCEENDFPLIIFIIQINPGIASVIGIITNGVDIFGQRRKLRAMAVRDSDLDPGKRAFGIRIQHLPLHGIGQRYGRVFIHNRIDLIIQDFVHGRGLHLLRKRKDECENHGTQNAKPKEVSGLIFCHTLFPPLWIRSGQSRSILAE